jgi:hypothetical protein
MGKISDNLKDSIDVEMANANVYSMGLEGVLAANQFKNSLPENNKINLYDKRNMENTTKKSKTSDNKKEVDEKWSNKYKKSINCDNPKGFSQKAHCQGRKKENKEATGSGSAGGFTGPLFTTTKGDLVKGGLKEEKLKGGIADGKTFDDLVKKYKSKGKNIGDLEKQLKTQLNKGIKVETEHTTNKKKATEIAMDHLFEDPEYYDKIKKMETKEATSSSSSGSYVTPSAWAKSTSKKDWRGKSKTQIPGGKFVQVKKKCKKFPYCNQGDIKALKIFESEKLKRVIKNISQKHNISENVIKNILIYEYEKSISNK